MWRRCRYRSNLHAWFPSSLKPADMPLVHFFQWIDIQREKALLLIPTQDKLDSDKLHLTLWYSYSLDKTLPLDQTFLIDDVCPTHTVDIWDVEELSNIGSWIEVSLLDIHHPKHAHN